MVLEPPWPLARESRSTGLQWWCWCSAGPAMGAEPCGEVGGEGKRSWRSCAAAEGCSKGGWVMPGSRARQRQLQRMLQQGKVEKCSCRPSARVLAEVVFAKTRVEEHLPGHPGPVVIVLWLLRETRLWSPGVKQDLVFPGEWPMEEAAQRDLGAFGGRKTCLQWAGGALGQELPGNIMGPHWHGGAVPEQVGA